MPSFFDLQKFAATGIAAPDMSAYDKMRALSLFGGGKTQTLTDVPPLTFKADGTPLISWSMKGNGSQQGTLTPDNPVMPEFVGVRTGNLIDMATVENGKNISSDGSITNYPKRCTTVTPIDVSTYSDVTLDFTATLTRTRIIYALFNDSTLVLRQTAVFSGSTIDVSSGNKLYICFYDPADTETVQKSDLSNVMLNLGSTALPYEPYGWAEKITSAGQTIPVYLGQVQTLRRVKKLVLTGDTDVDWKKSATRNYSWYFFPTEVGTTANTPFWCSHGATVTSVTDYDYGTVYCDNTLNIGIFPSNLILVSSLKNWLDEQNSSGTPVTIWCILAEPTTGIVNEPLCKIGDYADELHSEDAAVTIPTVKGQNTLTVESELPPSSMTITYK